MNYVEMFMTVVSFVVTVAFNNLSANTIFSFIPFAFRIIRSPFNTLLSFFFSPIFVFLGLSLLVLVSVGTIFSPICNAGLLIVSDSSICDVVRGIGRYTAPMTPISESTIAYPSLFESLSDALAQMVQTSPPVYASSIDLTFAHIAVDEIKHTIQNSELSRREDIAVLMEELSEEAKHEGRTLGRFASKIGASIDQYVL